MRARIAPLRISFATLLSAGGALFAAHAQQEVQLSIDMVEPQARAAAQAVAPGVAFEAASMELDEAGHHTVEISGRDANGDAVEVDLFLMGSDWVVEEIERAVTWEDTPVDVRRTLQVLFLRAWRPTLIERSDRPGGVIVYEIEGLDAANEAMELEIDASGALLALNKQNAS